MTWSRIPLASDTPNFSIQSEFDGVPYSLRFSWNAREGYWYADLLDEQESETLWAGQKVVPFVYETDDFEDLVGDLELGQINALTLFPGQLPGMLAVWSVSQPTGAMEDLTAWQLLYADLDEFASEASS